jgi:hypothetical protein
LSHRLVLVALIVAATALFAIGTAVERSERDEHAEPAAHVESESGEEGEAHEPTPHEESSEEILGIDPESTGLVATAVALSLALAAAAWWGFERPQVLWLVAAAMLAFAVLDIREIAHQIDESRGGVATLAGAVAALHLTAAALAAWWSRARSAQTA